VTALRTLQAAWNSWVEFMYLAMAKKRALSLWANRCRTYGAGGRAGFALEQHAGHGPLLTMVCDSFSCVFATPSGLTCSSMGPI
jgi:hypothetical protein